MFQHAERSGTNLKANGASVSPRRLICSQDRQSHYGNYKLPQFSHRGQEKNARLAFPHRYRRSSRSPNLHRISGAALIGAVMSAIQNLLFPTKVLRSYCRLCGGSGWQPVEIEGRDRCVTRCECRLQATPQPTPVRRRRVVDHKAAAAGERA